MKKLRLPRVNIPRKIVILAAALAVLAGGGVGGYLLYRNYTSSESVFYRTLAKAKPYNLIAEEYGKDDTSIATSQSMASKDGTLKGSGTLTCNTELPAGGELTIEAEVLHVQEKAFMRYTKLSARDMPDKAAQDEANQRMAKLANVWVILNDRVATSMIAKEYGVVFGLPDAVATTSKKHTDASLVALMREHDVITINEVETITHEGRKALKYSISVDADAYGNFMEAVQPDMAFKDAALGLQFDSGNEDMTVVIDKQKETLLYTESELDHPCRSAITDVDPSLEGRFPKYFTLKVTNREGEEPRKLSAPTEYLNALEYLNLLAEVNPNLYTEEE